MQAKQNGSYILCEANLNSFLILHLVKGRKGP